MEYPQDDEFGENPKEDSDPLALNRANFTRILWERFNDPSMAHHPTTIRYGQMLAMSMKWDEPDPMNGKTRILINIGECEECKKAGRPSLDGTAIYE
jgi:hypothetical protein